VETLCAAFQYLRRQFTIVTQLGHAGNMCPTCTSKPAITGRPPWSSASNAHQAVRGRRAGEHNRRGLLPVRTQSMHWLAHAEFSEAVERFLEREQEGVRGTSTNSGNMRRSARIKAHPATSNQEKIHVFIP